MLNQPKLTITENTKVSALIQYHVQGLITLEELSDIFNTIVQWDYRPLNAGLDWVGINTWQQVYTATQNKKLSMENYMFLAQNYETFMDNKERNHNA